MRIVNHPTVFLVGETTDDVDGLNATPVEGLKYGLSEYLCHVGAAGFCSDAGSGVEHLPEIYGRLCYKSFAPDLNPNVTKVTNGNQKYVQNVIGHKHGSVLEHVSANFIFADVTRVFTHELVRHRIGTGISQESLRYVRLTDLSYRFPEDALRAALVADGVLSEQEIEDALWKAKETFALAVQDAEDAVGELTNALRVKNMKSFDLKKKITSAMRRVAPIGLCTTIGWSCNMRTLRHVIEQRTARVAEEEIRWVFEKVAMMACERWPAIFSDYSYEVVDGLREYTTLNTKV